jgi:hypothetical protein
MFFKTLGIELPFDSAILRISKGIYERKLYFYVVCSTIAKIWNQLRCPLIDEWVKKMWYTYTIECYWAIKKNGILSSATTW